MKQYLSCFLVFLVLLTFSCRKEFPKVNDPANDNSATNFKSSFEQFWNGINNNYIFWDTDPTDWDEVYKHYHPLFAQLDIEKETDVKTAHLYFKEMTSNLIDCHLNLIFNDYFNLSDINPAWERKKNRPDFHYPIQRTTYFASVFNNYCDLGSKVMGSENGFMIVSATIDRGILYLYFSQFQLSDSKAGAVKQALENFFNVLRNTTDIKGVILDLRGNNGGYLADLNLLMGRMIDKQLNVGYTRCKTGDGRLDYSPWIPAYITSMPDARKITAPIVVLADMYSASMAEITIMAVKSLPNGYFIGEQTWGAQGPLIDVSAKFNSGIFECRPFFKIVTISSHTLKDLNGKQYENIGLTPDIEVKHNQQALNTGKDTQLERAIELIKKL